MSRTSSATRKIGHQPPSRGADGPPSVFESPVLRFHRRRIPSFFLFGRLLDRAGNARAVRFQIVAVAVNREIQAPRQTFVWINAP